MISVCLLPQNFHEVAHQARNRQDLLRAFNRFLDGRVILPPSEVVGDKLVQEQRSKPSISQQDEGEGMLLLGNWKLTGSEVVDKGQSVSEAVKMLLHLIQILFTLEILMVKFRLFY